MRGRYTDLCSELHARGTRHQSQVNPPSCERVSLDWLTAREVHCNSAERSHGKGGKAAAFHRAILPAQLRRADVFGQALRLRYAEAALGETIALRRWVVSPPVQHGRHG